MSQTHYAAFLAGLGFNGMSWGDAALEDEERQASLQFVSPPAAPARQLPTAAPATAFPLFGSAPASAPTYQPRPPVLPDAPVESRKRRQRANSASEGAAAGSGGGGGGGGGSGGGTLAEGGAVSKPKHLRFDPASAALGLLAPESALAVAPTLRDNPRALAALIAATLREADVAQVLRAVEVLGAEAAEQLLVATVAVEEGGGLRTADGSRKRSAGGVFYHLMKDVASKAQMGDIFRERELAHRRATHAKARAAGGGFGGMKVEK
jgi:hypothetical protein